MSKNYFMYIIYSAKPLCWCYYKMSFGSLDPRDLNLSFVVVPRKAGFHMIN